jgi:hypothetical protein
MIDREHFTLVFKGDISKFKLNPLNTETPFGRPEAAGRGDAFEECNVLRERLEYMENKYGRIDWDATAVVSTTGEPNG